MFVPLLLLGRSICASINWCGIVRLVWHQQHCHCAGPHVRVCFSSSFLARLAFDLNSKLLDHHSATALPPLFLAYYFDRGATICPVGGPPRDRARIEAHPPTYSHYRRQFLAFASFQTSSLFLGHTTTHQAQDHSTRSSRVRPAQCARRVAAPHRLNSK